MGTIVITTAGFSPLPAATPPLWPSYVAYPPGGSPSPNGSRQATLTDAEMIQLLTWVAASQFTGGGPKLPIATPTLAQILVAWVGTFFEGTKQAVQNYFTTPSTPPPPINLN